MPVLVGSAGAEKTTALHRDDKAMEESTYLLRNPANTLRLMASIAELEAGKPEALKHALSGYWSRRINDEHRLVYRVENDAILIASVRYHYT